MTDYKLVDFRTMSRGVAILHARQVAKLPLPQVEALRAELYRQTGGMSPGNDLTPLFRAVLDRLGVPYKIVRYKLPRGDGG